MASKHSWGKTIASLSIILVLCNCLVFFYQPAAFNWIDVIDKHIFKGSINSFLNNTLLAIAADQPENMKSIEGQEDYDAIYVMGGDGESLIVRLRAAAEWRSRIQAKKILTMKREGITAFDIELSRNLTNDEWTIKQLKNSGVEESDFELLNIDQGVFGTLSEIKYLIKISKIRGYHHVVIVSSNYHTPRIFAAVKALNTHQETQFIILGASEQEHTAGLVLEIIKYIAYRFCILPLLA